MSLVPNFVAILAALVGTAGAVLMLISRRPIFESIFYYFVGNRWIRIPVASAGLFVDFVGRNIYFSSSHWRNALRIFLYVALFNLVVLLVSRVDATGSIVVGIADIFTTSLTAVAFMFVLMNGAIAVPSAYVTLYFARRCATAKSPGAVARWWLMELATAYCFVALSLYLTATFLLASLQLLDGDVEGAKYMASIVMSFQHVNAIQWLWVDQPKIDDILMGSKVSEHHL